MNELPLIIQQDEEDAEAAEVLVDGMIGGHAYRFLLDTGAGTTSIIYDDYTATFESVEQAHGSGVFAKRSDDLITVPSLQLGPILKQNVTLARIAQASQNVRNLIGMDILKDYDCHFRFDERRVILDSRDNGAELAWHPLFMDKKAHPYVDVQFGKGTVASIHASSVWDTGASITIVDMGFVNRYSASFKRIGQSSGTDSTGSRQETPMFIMGESVIGGEVFAPHKVAGVDLSFVNTTIERPMDMILGYSTLSQAHWHFDFPRQRWTVTRL